MTVLLGIEETVCEYFMQDSAVAHTADFTLTAAEAVFCRWFSTFWFVAL